MHSFAIRPGIQCSTFNSPLQANSQENLTGTLLSDEADGDLLYTVITGRNAQSISRLRDALYQEIASWKWNDTYSDIFTVRGEQPRPISSWIETDSTVYFEASDSREY
ncbi:hypothetical protein BDN72DRAFT_832433 [Pluteus cervinus]|uniref:Uncharacterized protein n=1 Tax=Pluteus cervinus TaxID=181527 RepID=A0ACD3BAP2_9AGAR|nr:hypothetical protein BDN72DRAFT_832433 [Pluteus cervinus]